MSDGRNSLQDTGNTCVRNKEELQGKPPVRFIAFWISVLAFASIYTLFYGAGSDRQLLVSLTTDQPGGFQVFFDHGASFSEQDSSRVAVRPGSHTYSIRLTEEPLRALRLDPDPTMVRVRLDKVVIQDRRTANSATLPLTDLSPLNEIASIGHEEIGATMVSTPNAQDPQTLLPVHEKFTPRSWELVIGRACRGFCVAGTGSCYRLSIGATTHRRTDLFSNFRRLDACRGNGVHYLRPACRFIRTNFLTLQRLGITTVIGFRRASIRRRSSTATRPMARAT